LCVALLALAPGCIIKVPIQDSQSIAFPQGVYDVSIGGPGEQVFNLTIPISSLCSLPTAGDVITEFLASGQGLPIGRFLLEADHAWVEAFTFGFDGANFPISTQVGEPFELRARIVGPDGELARCSATQIPPLAALTMIAKPTSPIDILQFHLPPGECLRAEFILTGKNPRVNFPVAVGITMKVELHTRGFIDVSAFGLP